MAAPPGERHGLSKLTEEDVRDIRRRYASGEATYMSLAIDYDISTGTVSAVIRYKTWRHV